VRALAASGLAGFAVAAAAGSADAGPDDAAGTGPRPGVRYAQPAQQCRIGDRRLAQLSGLATVGERTYAVSESGPVAVSVVERDCRVGPTVTLRVPPPADPAARPPAAARPAGQPEPFPPLPDTPQPPEPKPTDVEDLAAAPDGALWLADTGGDTATRRAVSLYRWPGRGAAVQRFDLRYPDGPHDAEALLITLAGQAVVVTKAANGRSGVYAARLPLPPAATMAKVADLDVSRLRTPGDTAPGSLEITGGAVSPDGVHFALRTHTAAYEWDAPDGDVVRALRHGPPRPVPLARSGRGEAVGYAQDGRGLVTAGGQPPVTVHAIAVTRAPLAAGAGPAGTEPAGSGVAGQALAGAGAAALLGAAVALLGRQRRRSAARVTTYQSAD
jgi:hypothetical protein